MYSQILSQASLSLVTIDEAKKQCRVTSTFDDDYLNSLIPVASELAQVYTKRLMTLGQVVTVIDEYKSIVQLPYGDVTAIDSLLIDGLASTDYEFEPVSQKLYVKSRYTTLKVTYSCGYAVTPVVVKHAVLLLISTLYNSRDDFVTGLTVASMPLTSTRLLDSVKYYVS
jgi:hypothetical protein